jgi:hypothetical protein
MFRVVLVQAPEGAPFDNWTVATTDDPFIRSISPLELLITKSPFRLALNPAIVAVPAPFTPKLLIV